ncbi:MAG: AMP-binding protein [Moorea sp. SIO3I7]|uniref:non-ribosomal peptide synthetase family protein n=1 Tax=Moorena sp. SIO3I8 TaxID=2607833 RepID=UPI0013BED0B2|nr:AMP-binding protein [Moorena sp. SIO3I8]NEN98413.1 AMP-binding protein [Moorena sp. SIO3I7]NEO07167.1 AMP-binding protein [Moorena sp. SIO3I8]
MFKKKTFKEFKKEDIEQSVPDRFRQQVKLYSHRLAIKYKKQQLTYEQLNKISNRIAAAIISKCGQKEGAIALLFEPGIMAITAILGSLKAGKIWVLLDASLPEIRLNYILEDSQTIMIVSNNHNSLLAEKLAQNSCQLLNLDSATSGYSDQDCDYSVSPDSLAYILYTSGSTGKPKAVVQNHRNILHAIRLHTNSLHLCSGDRLSQLSTYAHLSGLTAIFRALLNGGAVFPFNIKQEGVEQLADYLIEEEITVYHSVPTVFRHFINTLTGKKEFPNLRLIHLGGESVSIRDVELYKQHFSPNCILLNNLGSTEVGTYGHYFINQKTQLTGNIVPVVCNLEDKEVLLLDEEGKKVRENCIGEIAVKSPYLALGYWRKPHLTKEKFRSEIEGNSRIYLTGDLGRLLPDGSLEYLGRKDLQVKIRGQRIEIAEIELKILEHRSIKETAVITADDRFGDKQLVAYVVVSPDKNEPPSSLKLQNFLIDKLPQYMIPSTFILWESLPHNSSGKIDRKALPEPDFKANIQEQFIAPRNETEIKLTQIWQEVLGIKKVGINHNFFELGGHSLLAVRLVAEIEKVTQTKLPLAALFQFTTIEEIASLLKEPEVADNPNPNLSPELLPLDTDDLRALLTIVAGREGARPRPDSLMVTIRPTGVKPPLFYCANGVGEISTLARYLGEEQPVYFLESGSVVIGKKGQPTQNNIKAIAASHVRDILEVYPTGPILLTGYSFGKNVAYEVAKQLQERGKKVAFLAILDTWGSGQMYRYYLQRIEPALVAMKKELLRGSLVSCAQQLGSLLWEVKDNLTVQKSMSAVGANQGEYLIQGYSGKITLFLTRVAHDHRYNIKIRRWLFPLMGWEEHVVDLIRVPGKHHTMIMEPHGRVLAEKLKMCIDQALAAEADRE